MFKNKTIFTLKIFLIFILVYVCFSGQSHSIPMGGAGITNTTKFPHNIVIGKGAAGTDYTTTYDGETNDYVETWMEDEDYLKISNKLLLLDRISFTQTDENEYIDSLADGYMDYSTTTAHRFNMSTADTDVLIQFIGTTNSGQFSWMEDEDYFIFADAVRVGDSSNYLNIASDGTITMVGTARVTNHLTMTTQDLGVGSSPPTAIFIGNYAGKSYTIGDDSIVSIKPQHDIDETADIAVHVTWAINEAYATNSGEVQWQLDWSLTPAAGGEALDAPTHSGTIKSGDIDIPATAKHLVHTTSLIIDAANYAYDDVLGIQLSRVAIDGGNDPAAAEPVIVEWHLEYTKNKQGT